MKSITSIGAINRSLAAVGEAVDRSSFRSVRENYNICLDLDATNRVLEGIGEEVDETSFDETDGMDLDATNRVLEAVGEEVGPVSFGEVYPVVRLGCFDRDRDLRVYGYARN